MKLNKIFLIGFLFLIVLNVNSVHIAADICVISPTQPPEVPWIGVSVSFSEMFSVSANDNAHASPDPNFYPDKVWCAISGVDETCSGALSAPFLNFSGLDNAHVESPDLSTYANTSCFNHISVLNGDQTFCYTLPSCPNDFIGLVNIGGQPDGASFTNAHVAEYSDILPLGYNAHVCCGGRDLSVKVHACDVNLNPSSIEVLNTSTISTTCYSDLAKTDIVLCPPGINYESLNLPVATVTGIIPVVANGISLGTATITASGIDPIEGAFSCNTTLTVNSVPLDGCSVVTGATCEAVCSGTDIVDPADGTCDLAITGDGAGICCLSGGGPPVSCTVSGPTEILDTAVNVAYTTTGCLDVLSNPTTCGSPSFWASGPVALASMSSLSGLLTGNGTGDTGTVLVTATYVGFSCNMNVEVVTTSCNITLVNSAIDEGDLTTANVNCVIDGVPGCPADLEINSDPPLTASVNQTGNTTATVTGVNAGTTDITARSLTNPGVNCLTPIKVSTPGGGSPTNCRIVPNPINVQVSDTRGATVECLDAASNLTICPTLGIDSVNSEIAAASIEGTAITVTAVATIDSSTIIKATSTSPVFTCPATVNVTATPPIEEICGDGIRNQVPPEDCDGADLGICNIETQFCNLSCICQDNGSLSGNHFAVSLFVKNKDNLIDSEFFNDPNTLDPINLAISVQRFPAAIGEQATLQVTMTPTTGGADLINWTDITLTSDKFSQDEIATLGSVGTFEIVIPEINIVAFDSGSYTIKAKVISGLDGPPINDDELQLFDNQDSEGVVIRIGSAGPGGLDFVAAPEIHPIFIVLIILGIIFITRRN